MTPQTLTVELPSDVLEQLAARAAELVLDRLADASKDTSASEFMTPEEAAVYLRCDRQRVYDLASSGRLPRVKEGGRTLHRRADVVALLLPDQPGTRMNTGRVA